MKLVIVVADGAADEAYEELNDRTPLSYANTPWMDRVADEGQVGLVDFQSRTAPVGSQTAFLRLFGVSPHIKGLDRSLFEAQALGVAIGPDDVVFRCNIVRTHDDHLVDFTAGQIGENQAKSYLSRLPPLPDELELYHSKSYRNVIVWRNCPLEPGHFLLLPPHEHLAGDILPALRNRIRRDPLTAYVRSSMSDGLMLWPWGPSRAVSLSHVPYKLGMVTALAFLAGLTEAVGGTAVIPQWATGYANTHYESKDSAARELIECCDVVVVHCNAPDEEAHVGNVHGKVNVLQDIDKLVRNLFVYLALHYDEWRLVVTADHYTVCRTRQHARGACPYAIVGTGILPSHSVLFSETIASLSKRPHLRGEEAIRVWTY